MPWLWIWLAVALVAAIGELTTTGLFLACVSVAAIFAAASAQVFAPTFQVAIFAVIALAGIAVVRPVVVHALGWSTAQISGPVAHSHIVNRRATVTRLVDSSGGQIRIGEGEFWSARSFEPSDIMPVGSTVEVILVDGLSALVAPVEQPSISVQASSEKGAS